LPEVKIYTRKMCGFCSAAIRLLNSKGIAFQQLDATFNPALRGEMIAQANGSATFPQIFIGKHHVGGCNELFALEQAGKLDVMLDG